MGTLVVAIQPKREYEDLPGQAAASQLAAKGFTQFTDVRVGRRLLLSVEGPVTDEHIDAARRAAETVLMDPATEEIARIISTNNESSVAPWDDFEEVWGGDEGTANVAHPFREGAHGHEIRERDLGAVESGSIAWFDEAEES